MTQLRARKSRVVEFRDERSARESVPVHLGWEESVSRLGMNALASMCRPTAEPGGWLPIRGRRSNCAVVCLYPSVPISATAHFIGRIGE